jgi:hypothetical protein
VAASILEVRFRAEGAGRRIDLDHRGCEEFGLETGTRLREAYEPGWDEALSPLTARVAPAVLRTRQAAVAR